MSRTINSSNITRRISTGYFNSSVESIVNLKNLLRAIEKMRRISTRLVSILHSVGTKMMDSTKKVTTMDVEPQTCIGAFRIIPFKHDHSCNHYVIIIYNNNCLFSVIKKTTRSINSMNKLKILIKCSYAIALYI